MKTTTQMVLETVHNHHMMCRAQFEFCLDVLIPAGYIDATGTWFLTEKGLAALAG